MIVVWVDLLGLLELFWYERMCLSKLIDLRFGSYFLNPLEGSSILFGFQKVILWPNTLSSRTLDIS